MQEREKVKAAPLPPGALHPDFPAVELHQRFRQRQTQSVAVLPPGEGGLLGAKAVKDMGQDLRRDAAAVVRHADAAGVRLPPEGYLDRSPPPACS